MVNFEHWAVTCDKSVRYVNIMLFIRCCDQCKIYIYLYIKTFYSRWGAICVKSYKMNILTQERPSELC